MNGDSHNAGWQFCGRISAWQAAPRGDFSAPTPKPRDGGRFATRCKPMDSASRGNKHRVDGFTSFGMRSESKVKVPAPTRRRAGMCRRSRRMQPQGLAEAGRHRRSSLGRFCRIIQDSACIKAPHGSPATRRTISAGSGALHPQRISFLCLACGQFEVTRQSVHFK